MIENDDQLRKALENARLAYHKGNHAQTRYWARIAAELNPGKEEPWLWLAAVSSPRASVAYLQKALSANPNSKRARQAMHWAVQRLRSEPLPSIPPERAQPSQQRPRVVQKQKRTSRARFHWWIPAILLLVLISSALVSPALGFYINTYLFRSDPLIAARVGVDKASSTPTATNTPTITPSPTPTNTPTPTSTNTPTPTLTETPTLTFTPYPTDTEIPTEEPIDDHPPEPGGDDRWIDVDLTNQLTYAYEGDVLVNTFLVSTGTWEHPTVTGQYHIYVKYVYADMEGPGYYLPDVPYVMYFYDGYGLHGTYWHSNFGTPMSHGCINLSIPDSEWLFYWADVGTLVNIHY